MKTSLLTFFLSILFSLSIHSQTRWQIQDDGSTLWQVEKNIPHYDHIEMAGEKVAAVLRYGVNSDQSFSLERSLVWPMLRTIPNNTHASLMQRFSIDYLSTIMVDGFSLTNEKVKSIKLNGTLTVVSEFSTGYLNIGIAKNENMKAGVEVTHELFPSRYDAAFCELYTIKNIGTKTQAIIIPQHSSIYETEKHKGVDGSYTLVSRLYGTGTFQVKPNESIIFGASIQAFKETEKELFFNIREEKRLRDVFVKEVRTKLLLNTPDKTINTAFDFAKIRASESIFKTQGGYMHAPGGESYYAAIWANDQAEYVNPLFPFIGYDVGNESAMNSFRHFARFMNDEYEPIPSSIIAEGLDIWNGAKDRGDGAMIAYGAARYALATGSVKEAEELWGLIEWCLEFCKRKLTEDGVVASDSDELEGRFPAGDANLCTSSLYYDALLSASYLARELGKSSSTSKSYKNQAHQLKAAINNHFGANVEGFETYRYYDGNDILRSWICIPLTVGIYERKKGTIDALFSPRLWTDDGLLTQAGTETYWDRSTLYALRGVYASGEKEKATTFLKHYSTQRLLGEHVPYAIEAWPEGSQRHLSAESGLYCRIITEGIFGIRPMGFDTFELTPQLPGEWDFMELKNINAFNNLPFDINVKRVANKLEVKIERENKVLRKYVVQEGASIKVRL